MQRLTFATLARPRRTMLAAFLALAATGYSGASARTVEVVGRQRLFGQCSALVIASKTMPCEGINFVHNLDGRSYFEIPSDAVTVLIGGVRTIVNGKILLNIDSFDPGTGNGETAIGECQMQTSGAGDTLLALTCKGTGSSSGTFLFIYKPSEQKIDGRPPRV